MSTIMMAEKEKIEEKSLSLQRRSALTPEIIETGQTAQRNPAKLFLRVFTRELWREIGPLTKTLALLLIIALVGGVSFLGYLAYRDREQGRSLMSTQSRRLDEQGKRIDGQNDQLASLKEQVTQSNQQTDQQINDLKQADQGIDSKLTLAPKLWSAYSNGTCLIAGSYILVDPGTNKPLRYPEENDEGSETERLMMTGTQSPLTPAGNGPILELEFVGTGFHVGDGYILTNRHIASQPWATDVRAQYLISMSGGQSRLQSLLAYFPGRHGPYTLKFKRASQQVDLAVCMLNGKAVSADIPVLPLDREAEAAAVGKEVVMMGYPSGPNRMLALLPEAEAFGLQNKYGASLVTLLNQLQKRKLIKPLTTQGHITDLYQNRIVFDAATSEGASGTPMFGQSGRVIGVTFAVFIENSASNFAVPISSGIALLESAGWRQKVAE